MFPVLFTFYKQGVLKLKNNSGAKRLMNAFSKVFEKVIYVRIYQHLINHSALVNEQFGFKAQLSTAKASFNLIN